MSSNYYCNKEKNENIQNEVFYFLFLFKVVYFDMQNPNLMNISVNRNRRSSIIQKTGIFRIIKSFRIQFTKKSTSVAQLLINSDVLLPPAAKRVELFNFSGPKRSFGSRDCADCKQRGTK